MATYSERGYCKKHNCDTIIFFKVIDCSTSGESRFILGKGDCNMTYDTCEVVKNNQCDIANSAKQKFNK